MTFLFLFAWVAVPVAIFSLMLASPLKLPGTLAGSAGPLLLAWIYSPALAVYLSGLLLAVLFCGSPAVRPRHPVLRILAGLCVVGVLCGAGWLANRGFYGDRLQLRAELRGEFPIESLEERLAVLHPQELSAGMRRRPVVAPVSLSHAASTALEQRENDSGENWWGRQGSLEQLHNLKRDEFLKAAGFGSIRMRFVSRGHVELPVSQPVVLPEPPPPRPAPSFGEKTESKADAGNPEASDGDSSAAEPAPASQMAQTLNSVYLNGLEDFTDPNQIGFVPEPQHAAGFLPHSLDELPVQARRANGTTEAATPAVNNWRITRLELVSLLKHAEPVVYESRELPRMDRLADAPTRPLTGFERRSLRELRGERDLVTEEEGGRVLMLGAIRAGKQCLNCHDVRRGTLLGAFSYEIWLPGAAPVEEPPTEELPPAT